MFPKASAYFGAGRRTRVQFVHQSAEPAAVHEACSVALRGTQRVAPVDWHQALGDIQTLHGLDNFASVPVNFLPRGLPEGDLGPNANLPNRRKDVLELRACLPKRGMRSSESAPLLIRSQCTPSQPWEGPPRGQRTPSQEPEGQKHQRFGRGSLVFLVALPGSPTEESFPAAPRTPSQTWDEKPPPDPSGADIFQIEKRDNFT